MMLLPEAMQEWLPEGHLAYFIGDAVARPASSSGRVEARLHGAEPAAHGDVDHTLSRTAGNLVMLTGASLSEGGWWEPSVELEPPLGGGSGEHTEKRAKRAEEVSAAG